MGRLDNNNSHLVAPNMYELNEDAFRSPINAKLDLNFSPEPRGTNIRANISEISSVKVLGPAEQRKQKFLEAKKALDQQDEAEEKQRDLSA